MNETYASGAGQSKLANVLYTYELARRLKPEDNCTANALHPGIVGTHLGRYEFALHILSTSTQSMYASGSPSAASAIGRI